MILSIILVILSPVPECRMDAFYHRCCHNTHQEIRNESESILEQKTKEGVKSQILKFILDNEEERDDIA